MRKPLCLAATLTLIATAAAAGGPPSVAVDIPPIHSLVARVMAGVGTPDLILRPGASPHGYALRPSDARALQQADLVVWIGPDLTPWLADPIAALAGKAESLALIDIPGTTVLEFREDATFSAHGHGADAGDHDHHGHDPHAWLDPQNARLWLGVISEHLSRIDPDHAAHYSANAAAAVADLDRLGATIADILAPLQDRPFIVFHDAYQYFENHFDIPAAGSIALADGSDPGPARILEIQREVSDLGVTCAFAEPQFNPGLIETVFRGLDVRVLTLDPLGTTLTPGADLYPQILRDLAASLAACLIPDGPAP